MPNENKQVSRIIKGMKWDFHSMEMDEVSYGFAFGAVIENFDGNGLPVIQNEPSNLLCTNFPEGYKVIGVKNIIEQNRVLWFLHNPTTGASEIGETLQFTNCRDYAQDGLVKGMCDDCSVKLTESMPLESVEQSPCCVYHTIKNQNDFNFSEKYPVSSIEYRIKACEIEIFFTDANNSRRRLVFEYQNDDVSQFLTVKKDFLVITGYQNPPCETPIYGTAVDVNKMNVQPNISTPCIEFIDLVSGGSNKAGTYQFMIGYADKLGNKLSSYASSTNPISIRTKDETFVTDYVTDRAIALQINNLEQSGPYEYYNLVVAKTFNSFTAFYLVGTFPVTQTKYTYTGNNEAEIKLTEGDIFQRLPYYKTAGSVTSSNNILFWANMMEFSKPNLQRVANGIKLLWQTIAIPEAVYRNPRNINKFRSYMRDEVYPFAAIFIYDNGEESPAYHIPGRMAISTDLETIANSDVIVDNTCVEGSRDKRWQVYNTAAITGGDLQIYKDCEETCYQYGEFAYWESTEHYPNKPEVWGSLCGQPIRHHKFPDSSVTHIHNYQNGTAVYADNNLVFPIGVRVDHQSVRTAITSAVTAGIMTQEEASRIVGYRIVRGNRFRNKSIVAKGLLFDVNKYRRKDGGANIDNEDIYFANYPYNDLRNNPFITDQLDNYDDHNTPEGSDLAFTFSKRYTFHSPDTHFNEPSVGTELKFETVEYGNSEGWFTKSKKQAKQKLLSDASYALALTGGIVAAMLRTEERECIEYTIKSDYTLKHGDTHADGNGSSNYQGVYGNVVGSSPGATATTPVTMPLTGSGTFSIDSNQQDDTEQHNAENFNGFDETTGLPSPINGVESYTKKTCKGTRKQYFNNPTLNGNAMGVVLGALGGIIGALNKTADFMRVVLEEMNIILDLIKALTPYRDWTVQYHSVGKYNNYKTVANTGNKRRVIQASSYLKSENAFINEEVNNLGQSTSIKFNNWNRESSLYLKYDGNTVPNAGAASGVTDTSRITMPDAGCSLDKKVYSPISSYYAAIKNYVPDQYGDIYNIDYVPTGSCIYDIDTPTGANQGVYGGDTFINRFGLKVKVPYFLATTFGLPPGTDFDYSEYPNLAFPRHYYNTTLTLGSEIDGILDLLDPTNIIDNLGRPKSIRDCSTSKFFYQNGYIYLYHYGIPYFLCESDINVDYRHAENSREKDFYPHQGDLDFWLQEENVSIREDNYYFYNRDYSKQNKEMPVVVDGPDFEPSRTCRVEHPNRIVYATDGNWLVYKPNDFYDFPLSKGKITSIDGIENETVIVRTINSVSVFKAFNLIPTDGETIQVGTGGVFKNKPQSFAETTLGYIGSQHKAILHTEFGHIVVDAKRGEVFNILPGAGGLDPLAKDGMRNWFAENLPFRVLRDFPNMPEDHIDNSFNGLGIALSFDKRYKRFLLTKRDFKRKDKGVQYDPISREFFKMVNSVRTVVKPGDRRYFSDTSFTVSYSFISKFWVSFHAYKPNYYVDFVDFFGSGNESGMWLHNLTNASFQVFYGKLTPFIVEPVVKFDGPMKSLTSVEIDTEVRRYANEFDYTVKSQIAGFNKAVVYNDLYNSGMLNLTKVDKNKLSQTGMYPVRNLDSWDIEIALANYKWRFNQFYNLVRDNSELPLWIYKGNNAEKELNATAFQYKKSDFSLSRIRGQWFKTRLINDQWSNYKILHKFQIANQLASFR